MCIRHFSNTHNLCIIWQVETRQPVVQAVLRGDVLLAIGMACALKKDIFQKRRDVLFDLMCLEYVNRLRSGRIDDAVSFARTELSPFGYMAKSYVMQLEECLALLAYESPSTSPVGEYMSEDYKLAVAEALNGALLEAAGLPRRAPLEQLVQHLTAATDCLAQETSTKRFRFSDWVRSPNL